MVSGIGLGDSMWLVPGSWSKMVKGSSLSGARCTGKVAGDGYRSSGNLPYQNRLEMGDMICGRLRQPAMRYLGGGWAGAKLETRDEGRGTRQGMVQHGEGGNKE